MAASGACDRPAWLLIAVQCPVHILKITAYIITLTCWSAQQQMLFICFTLLRPSRLPPHDLLWRHAAAQGSRIVLQPLRTASEKTAARHIRATFISLPIRPPHCLLRSRRTSFFIMGYTHTQCLIQHHWPGDLSGVGRYRQ
jgi:hypothetical protein